jgi:hypothetical protein
VAVVVVVLTVWEVNTVASNSRRGIEAISANAEVIRTADLLASDARVARSPDNLFRRVRSASFAISKVAFGARAKIRARYILTVRIGVACSSAKPALVLVGTFSRAMLIGIQRLVARQTTAFEFGGRLL